jgi:NAD(P)-dependent dehydrogenase (short-subunit alcohol dehydrogenase family)
MQKIDIKNKVVLITGASSGIGAATAMAFNQAGARLAIAARRKEKLDELANLVNDALILETDLSVEAKAMEMVDRTLSHFGRIDILINNAAAIIVSPAETVSSKDLLHAYKTNLIAPVIATQRAIQFMKTNGGGHIINVGSPGFMMGIPFYAPYVCSKAAFSAWTRTLQAELAGSNIVVSEYFPGYVRTDSRPESRIGEVEQDFLMSDRANAITRHFTKPQTPEEIASQLLNLAQNPKLLTYSGFSVRIGAWIALFSSFRLNLSKEMADTARQKQTNFL